MPATPEETYWHANTWFLAELKEVANRRLFRSTVLQSEKDTPGGSHLDGFAEDSLNDIAPRALASPETAATPRAALQILSFGVGVMVMIGTIGMSMAVFLWSADLAPDRGSARWTGVLGLVAGAGLVIALPAGIGRLDLTGMTLVVV